MLNNLTTIWSDSPAISFSIWLVILITVLYLGRHQAHHVIHSSFHAIYTTMRLWAYSLKKADASLQRRNKEVLLAVGAADAQKHIEREFSRVNGIVQRDLSQYPALHRQIKDAIEKVEEDYQNSTDSGPLPPAWGEVVTAISALPSNGDPTINKVLQDIKKSIDEAHRQTLSAYQKTSLSRQSTLSKMQPDWRSLDKKMDVVKGKIDGLDERTNAIDEQMARYEAIRNQEDKIINSLTSSSLTQFFIAGLVLGIAVLGGLINFQLIAMPMSEMVGGTSYIGAVKTSDIAALVIILIEITMGLFLLESLRITHLFPIIGSMDDKMRRRMMMISFCILTILASIEASLAYMRDLLALDHEALQQSLIGAASVATSEASEKFRWIPSIGQMVMGFVLPFALSFIAIPLESFIHSLRTLLGLLAIGLLRALRIVIRAFGGLARHMGKVCISLYDLIIMLPLSIELLVNKRLKKMEGTDIDMPNNELSPLTRSAD